MIINILQHLDREKHELTLVLFDREGVHLEDVPPHVKQVFLFRKGKISYIKLIFLLSHRLFSGLKPDLVISFMILPNILTLFASLLSFYKPIIIISVRNNPDLDFTIQKNSYFKRMLLNILYPFASHIIVISKGIKEVLVKNFKLNRNRITVVYNGINITNVQTLAMIEPEESLFQRKNSLYITACGRLTPQKGYPDLIKAFSKITYRTKAMLYIIGEGDERRNLTALIKNLNMEDKILLLGFKANPFQYIARSDVFVLSSLFEGFANVIVEAMACGTPVIAADCPFGPGEIIEHGKNGILIPPGRVDILADTLFMLLEDKPMRERLSSGGKKRVEDFHVMKMVAGYESVFHSFF